MRTCRSRSLLARISSDVDVGAKVTDTDVSDVLPGQVAVNTHAAATVCLVLAILVIPTQVAIQLLSNPNPNPNPNPDRSHNHNLAQVAIQFFSYSVMHRGMVRVSGRLGSATAGHTTGSSDCI